jgi:hypothetical protein
MSEAQSKPLLLKILKVTVLVSYLCHHQTLSIEYLERMFILVCYSLVFLMGYFVSLVLKGKIYICKCLLRMTAKNTYKI